MTEKARIKIRGMVMQLKKECEDATKTNEKLEAENKKLKAQLKKGGSAPSGNIEKQMQKALQQQQPYLNPLKKVVESLKKWRNDVVALQEERDSLKKQIESGAAGGGMNPDQISSIRAQLA